MSSLNLLFILFAFLFQVVLASVFGFYLPVRRGGTFWAKIFSGRLLGMATCALLQLFLKFEYQRRVAAGHLFGDEAAEVLRLGPLIQQSISHKLEQRAELLVSQSDWGDQQRVEALEDWLDWAAEDHEIGSDAGIEGIIVAS